MTKRYATPSRGTTNWDVPLNDNFDKLATDVEHRDVEANMSNYDPVAGSKFFASDSGAVYTGDGSSWSLVGYVTRPGGGDVGHYVSYADGLVGEEINKFVFSDEESLEVTRISAPLKGVAEGTIDTDVTLTVYEGGLNGTKLVEVNGNESKVSTDPSLSWVAETPPVSVAVTNQSGNSVSMAPKVWVNFRVR
jgi:hypothetical protein